MTGRIPQPFIDEIVARSDIVEIIGARDELIDETLGDAASHGASLTWEARP